MKKTTLSALVIALAAGSALAAAPVANTTAPAPTGHEHVPNANMPAGEHGGMGGEHKGPGGHMFEEVDTNHDGSISKEEWVAKGDKMFSELDANKDGKISQDEMKAHHDMMRAKWEQHKAEGNVPATPATGTPAAAAPAKH